MKKVITIFLAVVLSLSLPVAVVAAELTGCIVKADAVEATAGETVTVAISVADNPGFTNFAILLDYDRANLTLTGIETAETDALTSTNLVWQDEAGEPFGYVVSAAAESVREDGVLFTATFEIAADFSGTAEVTPIVQYIRNNEAVISVFEPLRATVVPGAIISVLGGDVNGDGIVEYDDVMLAYRAFCGKTVLTPEQLSVVDQNGNGTVEETEYLAIYAIYTGG